MTTPTAKALTPAGEWVEGLPIVMFGSLHITLLPDCKTAYDILPSTVCRATGLKDSAGKMIYEGDEAIDTIGNKITIMWNQDKASFVLRSPKWAFEHYFGEACTSYQLTLTGKNIHDKK